MLIKTKTLANIAAAIIAAGSLSLSSALAQEATTTLVEQTTTTAVVETTTAPAETAAEPSVEQRLADLEAYVNNGARTPDVVSKIAGPGPGHNAWQMTSTALVLFMTLPGLALSTAVLCARRMSSRFLP